MKNSLPGFSAARAMVCFAAACLSLSACSLPPARTPSGPTLAASAAATNTPLPPPPSPIPPTQPAKPPTPSPTPEGLPFPIRAAFYQPIYPEGWQTTESTPVSRFNPQAGLYSLDDEATIRRQIQEMQYGGIQAAILPWRTNSPIPVSRIESIFAAAEGSPFRWTFQYPVAQDEPPASLAGELRAWTGRQEYLKASGKPVLFLDYAGQDCAAISPWIEANRDDFFLAAPAPGNPVECPAVPDVWYPVLLPQDSLGATADAAVVRPGLWPYNQRMQIFRLPQRWQVDIQSAFTPDLKFHLVDSFNDWSSGTAVEPATEWASTSGMGAYLDVLNGGIPVPIPDVVLSGAGDISVCDWTFDDRVSELFTFLPGEIFTLGDNSNEQGTAEQYQRCFADSWGRFLNRIHPTPGNHDYVNPGAQAYFDYFGKLAGERYQGYYSYTRGSWLILSLNGNCSAVGGCYAGSPQETWLREQLESHPGQCALAYWHQPRWSSGQYEGGSEAYDAFWRALFDYGAELVLNGHDHHYERYFPQDPDGKRDDERGIRQFIVGTGGSTTRAVKDPGPNTDVLKTGVYGVLALTLYPGSYEWRFIPSQDESFTDWGRTACH